MISWNWAFAQQASSDLEVYELLTRSRTPTSHRVHYLQMWLKKLCKAYTPNEEFRRTHNVIGKVLPVLIRDNWRRIGFDKPPNFHHIRQLCRQVDLLHPQVDDNRRRLDNTEYPWLTVRGEVEVPVLWTFPIAGQLNTVPGKLMLKAAIHLTRKPNLP